MTFPESALIAVQNTDNAGRTVIALQDLKVDSSAPASHLLMTSSPSSTLSPVAHVIFRQYLREVCAWCFTYDRGREWKVRDCLRLLGVVFCSEPCRDEWIRHSGELGMSAHGAVESIIKSQTQNRSKKKRQQQASDETECRHIRPTLEQIGRAWEIGDVTGDGIREARLKQDRMSKTDRRKIRMALEITADHDILFFFLSGVLSAAMSTAADGVPLTRTRDLLPSLLTLAADSTPYVDQASLIDHVNGFHVLLAILPEPLLPYTQSRLCNELVSRASHNAFSIRPSSRSEGEYHSEFLGWGVWPEASFFNHSCDPSVRKDRDGRIWKFRLDRGVARGEEICISYLGGEERELGCRERRERLQETWGFLCNCRKCTQEGDLLGH